MKNIFLIGFLILLIASCRKNDGTAIPTNPNITDSTLDVNKATVLKQGLLVKNMNYVANGNVKLIEYLGKKYISFESFNCSSAPDLKVYLATSNNASQFVSLGALKSTSGNQTYIISLPPDFNTYNKVLIWCQQFSVLIGSATIN